MEPVTESFKPICVALQTQLFFPTAGCPPLPAQSPVQRVCHLVPTVTHCLPPLPIASTYSPPVDFCPLLTAHCLVSSVHHTPSTTSCPLPTMCCHHPVSLIYRHHSLPAPLSTAPPTAHSAPPSGRLPTASLPLSVIRIPLQTLTVHLLLVQPHPPSPSTVRSLLPTVPLPLSTTHYLPYTACYLLPTTHCPASPITLHNHPWSTAHHLLPTTLSPLSTAECLVYHSCVTPVAHPPSTSHCSLAPAHTSAAHSCRCSPPLPTPLQRLLWSHLWSAQW